MKSRTALHSWSPLALGLFGLVTLAGCGSGGGSANTGGTTATLPAGTIAVDAVDGLRFDKSEYDAKAGAVQILYINKSSLNHNLLVTDSTGTRIGPELTVQSTGSKESGSYTLAAGTYNVFCNIPGHEGMKAKLIVT